MDRMVRKLEWGVESRRSWRSVLLPVWGRGFLAEGGVNAKAGKKRAWVREDRAESGRDGRQMMPARP